METNYLIVAIVGMASALSGLAIYSAKQHQKSISREKAHTQMIQEYARKNQEITEAYAKDMRALLIQNMDQSQKMSQSFDINTAVMTKLIEKI